MIDFSECWASVARPFLFSTKMKLPFCHKVVSSYLWFLQSSTINLEPTCCKRLDNAQLRAPLFPGWSWSVFHVWVLLFRFSTCITDISSEAESVVLLFISWKISGCLWSHSQRLWQSKKAEMNVSELSLSSADHIDVYSQSDPLPLNLSWVSESYRYNI